MKEVSKRPQKAKNVGFIVPLQTEKYFYVTNEGVDRRVIFSSREDFDRFEAYLYLLNSVESSRAANFFVHGRESEIFTTARGEKLVALGAYSFSPSEFHLLATSLVPNGLGKFMQKLQTAYTMYFNIKHHHSGRIFQSAYKSDEVVDDAHLRYIFSHIHICPAKMFDTHWDEAPESELYSLAANTLKYKYSSIGEYTNSKFIITSPDEFPASLRKIKSVQAHLRPWILFRQRRERRSSNGS